MTGRAGARLRARAGFTLLEVLIAFSILLIGLVPLVALYGIASATHRRSVDRANASLLATTVLADIKAQGDIPVEADKAVYAGYPGYVYDLRVSPFATVGQSALIEIIVYRDTLGTPEVLRMKTVLLRKVDYN